MMLLKPLLGLCGVTLLCSHMTGCALGGAAPAAAAGVAAAEYGKYKQNVRKRMEYLGSYESDLQPRSAEAIARGDVKSVLDLYTSIVDSKDYSYSVRAEAAFQIALIHISVLNPEADLAKGVHWLERVKVSYPKTVVATKAEARLRNLDTDSIATGALPQ